MDFVEFTKVKQFVMANFEREIVHPRKQALTQCRLFFTGFKRKVFKNVTKLFCRNRNASRSISQIYQISQNK